ncbi:hypothetical protein scyTo_0012055, partial [Scyliorhinus torazame]|nr:hypothetical protein [Scyliorhinus torazame]
GGWAGPGDGRGLANGQRSRRRSQGAGAEGLTGAAVFQVPKIIHT